MVTLKVKTKRPTLFGNQTLKADLEFELSDFLAIQFSDRGFLELLDKEKLPRTATVTMDAATNLEDEPKHKKPEKRK